MKYPELPPNFDWAVEITAEPNGVIIFPVSSIKFVELFEPLKFITNDVISEINKIQEKHPNPAP